MSKINRAHGPVVIVALDFATPEAALRLADALDPARCRAKVGKELFVRGGPEVVRRLVDSGFDVFLDLKFHDIPNTVAGACKAAADLGVWMLNVHAAGGVRMLEAAREAVAGADRHPLLIGVTLLTSIAPDELAHTGVTESADAYVTRLATLSHRCGLDGVVCSPADLTGLRASVPPEFLRVTPGVRPAGAERGDQRRTMTPGEALAAGASYLVVGRPITAAPDPLAALSAIEAEFHA